MDTLLSLGAGQDGCQAPLSFGTVTILVIVFCVLGLLWAFYNVFLVNKIDVASGDDGESDSLVGDIPQ